MNRLTVQFLPWQAIILTLLCLCFAMPGFAQADDELQSAYTPAQARVADLTVLQKKLADDRQQLAILQEQFTQRSAQQAQWLADYDPQDDFDVAMQDTAKLNTDLAQLQLEKINIELTQTQQNVIALSGNIRELEKRILSLAPSSEAEERTQWGILNRRLAHEKEKLALEQQRKRVLSDLQNVALQIWSSEKKWHEELAELSRKSKVEQLRDEQFALEAQVKAQQQAWETQLQALRSQQAEENTLADVASSQKIHTQDKIIEAEESLQLLNIQFTLGRIATFSDILMNHSAEHLGRQYIQTHEHLDSLLVELAILAQQISNRQALLDKRLQILGQAFQDGVLTELDFEQELALFNTLMQNYAEQEGVVFTQRDKIMAFQSQMHAGYVDTWTTRRALPTTIFEWQNTLESLWILPELTVYTLYGLFVQVKTYFSQAGSIDWLRIILLEFIWLFLGVQTYRYLKDFLRRASSKERNFSGKTTVVLAQLLYRNIIGLIVVGALFWLFMLSDLSYSSLIVPISLAVVWFVFKLIMSLARLSLFENVWDISGQDVKLYRGLQWTLGIGGGVTAMAVLAHQLPVSYDVVAIYDRLFMLVLLAVSFPLLKRWKVVPQLLIPYISHKIYIHRIVYLLGLLVPLTIFSNAIVGLIGYTQLAWEVGIIEAKLLCVITLWIFAKGVLDDFMTYLSGVFIRKISNGWVWTEALLKPLHTLLNIIVFVCATLVLFVFYGWDRESMAVQRIMAIGTQELFTIGEMGITIVNVLQFIVLFIVIRWAARWSREFAYRWLYSGAKDTGVRNSLSVFTQYATVIIGAYIILRVLGIDLTTLAVVLGALAVGIGFGLQNIANNLVSGVLLLIERPMRAGDIITLGSHEGEVTHIGMRATTIKTWDNMEVIIPNAETVSEAFTNWTHHDTIVRTVVRLRIGFNENPHQVQAIIYQVITRHPSVVDDPKPEVFLEEFGDSALRFEVRYHIDLNHGKSRMQVKSEILFNLWDNLKTAGIDIPYPRQAVELSEGSASSFKGLARPIQKL